MPTIVLMKEQVAQLFGALGGRTDIDSTGSAILERHRALVYRSQYLDLYQKLFGWQLDGSEVGNFFVVATSVAVAA